MLVSRFCGVRGLRFDASCASLLRATVAPDLDTICEVLLHGIHASPFHEMPTSLFHEVRTVFHHEAHASPFRE